MRKESQEALVIVLRLSEFINCAVWARARRQSLDSVRSVNPPFIRNWKNLEIPAGKNNQNA